MMTRVKKIVSGGQTGVDRAALDAAITLGVEHGGWCPRGRRAEDGPIDDRYQLQETESSKYAVRTRRNVRESDATLILYRNEISGGTALTQWHAQMLNKPCLAINLDEPFDVASVREWLAQHSIEVLNVAGPRESTQPGVGKLARKFVERLFDQSDIGVLKRS